MEPTPACWVWSNCVAKELMSSGMNITCHKAIGGLVSDDHWGQFAFLHVSPSFRLSTSGGDRLMG